MKSVAPVREQMDQRHRRGDAHQPPGIRPRALFDLSLPHVLLPSQNQSRPVTLRLPSVSPGPVTCLATSDVTAPRSRAILALSASLMRILTRYILREVTAHALIGAAIFTFVLFTRDLGRILELVVRASAPLPSVAEIFFFTVPLALTYTLAHERAGRNPDRPEPPRRRQRNHRHARQRHGHLEFSSRAGTLCPGRSLARRVCSTASTSLPAPRPLSDISKTASKVRKFPSKSSHASSTKDSPRSVFYVQDVKSAQGAAVWKGVFMADLSDATNPKITLAREAVVVSEGQDRLHLHLIDGSAHETDPKDRSHYQISTFEQTDIPARPALHRKQSPTNRFPPT